jgi:hypothetical protein
MQPAIAVAMLLTVGASVAAQDPTRADLLDKVGRYVAAYERDFSQSISDEHTRQREDITRGSGYRARSTHTERSIDSETLFAWFVNERRWLTIRNVLIVDGRGVPDSRGRLNRIVEDVTTRAQPADALIGRLRDESVRYNLGRIRRSFNDPMLSMQFLDPANQSGFTFTVEGAEVIDGISTWKLGFVETSAATAIVLAGQPTPSSGAIWLTPSGIVVRTRLTIGPITGQLAAAITVTYAPDASVGAWVPERMEEQYSQSSIEADREAASGTISCVTTYSNYRRRTVEPPRP